MKKKELLNLINKYLEGECSPDEGLILEKYLESFSKENAEWNEMELGNEGRVEEMLYSGIIQKIKYQDKNVFLRIVTSQYFLKIAALIAFLLILAAGILYTSGIFIEKSSLIVWNEKSTVPGEKLILRLADNSEITLNAGSKFRYPARFNGRVREVYLEGEAFFEVAHDSSKPFIVHCKNISTTVLGTKFNISAYSNEKVITISLVEGKVNISESKPTGIKKLAILQPKDQLLYSAIKNTYQIKKFDMAEIIGWRDNLLEFKDEPLKNVFIRLERAYGVKFELTPKSFENNLITASFQKASLLTISEVIKKLTGLSYNTIKENDQIKEIIFSQK
jgi:ferric-dicitrate binding protein FerR (iron transport regulator)